MQCYIYIVLHIYNSCSYTNIVYIDCLCHWTWHSTYFHIWMLSADLIQVAFICCAAGYSDAFTKRFLCYENKTGFCAIQFAHIQYSDNNNPRNIEKYRNCKRKNQNTVNANLGATERRFIWITLNLYWSNRIFVDKK